MNSLPTIRFFFIAAFLVGSTAPANAQYSSAARPGSWVRVVTQTQGHVEGQLVRFEPGSVTVLRGKEPTDTIVIPLSPTTKVLVSIGERGRTMVPVGIGLVVGAGIGAVIGAAAYTPCESEGMFGCFMAPANAGESAAMFAAGFGIVGGVIGAAVARSQKGHIWVDAGLPSIGVAPAGNGSVAMSLKFKF